MHKRTPIVAARLSRLTHAAVLVGSALLSASAACAQELPPSPGQLGDGGDPLAPIFPPGPWRACLIGCPSSANPEWLAETRYFCTNACAGLALVNYDCAALELVPWLEAHGWTFCPEGAIQGCCFAGSPPDCDGEPLDDCCLEQWCALASARCKCLDIEFANPSPPASSSCDLNDDDVVDCADLNDLLGDLEPNAECGITDEMILDVVCCFLGHIKSTCNTVWTPETGTACNDIRLCVEARLGRPLSGAELSKLMVCYGDACDCCHETDPPSGPGTPYFQLR